MLNDFIEAYMRKALTENDMSHAVLLDMTCQIEDAPLALENIGANQSYWDALPGFDLIAPDGYELVIRKAGRRITVERRKSSIT